MGPNPDQQTFLCSFSISWDLQVGVQWVLNLGRNEPGQGQHDQDSGHFDSGPFDNELNLPLSQADFFVLAFLIKMLSLFLINSWSKQRSSRSIFHKIKTRNHEVF